MGISEPDDAPIENKIQYLEDELKTMKKEMIRMIEDFMGTIAILCLPLSVQKRLEIGFKQIQQLPNTPLKVIMKRYVIESKASNLSFDDMINPIVSVLGFERAWKILDGETIKDNYGDWDLNRWKEMAKSNPCEGE